MPLRRRPQSAVGIVRPPLKRCENRYNTRTIVRIENGADDPYVLADNKARFFEEMNAAGVDWSFHEYARTPHDPRPERPHDPRGTDICVVPQRG